MRISLGWLNDLIDIDMTPEELAEKLTMAGFEVEEIEDRRTWADGVVIGRVLERSHHPNADKLSVCTVDIGASQPSTIVCGAANVRADCFVPVATVGAYLPMVDLKISPRKLRGVASAGMICSLAEVGLAKDSEGIHIFADDTLKPGDDARPYLGLDDVVLDLTSTANRADALSMVGIAREVAALTGKPLKLPEIPEFEIATDSTALTIQIKHPKACPVYIGTVIQGVQVQPSPQWLQQRLKAAGTRPINNIVDVTNYVLLEWGQPLHAFDCDRLQAVTGKDSLQIGVRLADPKETLTTLDSQSRKLYDQTLLITANDLPVALAGVMGGEDTEVSDTTTNLMLEAAWFDPASIRRSARTQGLRTEASARYERGVNQAELDLACRRALHLMTELAGGTITTQAVEDHRPSQASFSRTIELRLDRVNHVLGAVVLASNDSSAEPQLGTLSAPEIEDILTTLGCTLNPGTPENPGDAASVVWQVTVPPYRYRDLEREIDLIEEIARLYGYDRFTDTLPAKNAKGFLSPEQQITREIKTALRALGLTEVIHYSLVKPKGDRQITLSNPLFEEYSALRTEMLSALIDAFQYNLEQGSGALNGFEIGRIFWRSEEAFHETDRVAGILGGDPSCGRWIRSGKEKPMSWFEAKGIVECVFERLGLSVTYQPASDVEHFHPGRTASLWIDKQHLGTFGQLHPQLCQERDLPSEVYAFDLAFDVLMQTVKSPSQGALVFQPFSSFPASDRDLAFYAPTSVAVAEIEAIARKAGKSLLASVELFDEYQGDNVPDGQRSLAFRLVYRASDRTLTDDDVDPVHQKVRDALVKQLQVSLRS
ncbi:MAG: phenylalanine--tRNA ligase subunit beta [Elainellaceae cyanobacterium]